jgi:chorismate mutase
VLAAGPGRASLAGRRGGGAAREPGGMRRRAEDSAADEGGNLVAVRAIRGATQVAANERAALLEGTSELVTEVMSRNRLTPADVISVVFTATHDLDAEFPALAARKLGFQDVPLLCATEMNVPGSMPLVVRLMMHVETEQPRAAVQHVYLRGAIALRLDIAQ